MKIPYRDFKERQFQSDMYFQSDAQDVYIRWSLEDKTFHVKFKGQPEFLAKRGSELVAETYRDSNLITKDEYESAKHLKHRMRVQH
jgi:hypothetical protein